MWLWLYGGSDGTCVIGVWSSEACAYPHMDVYVAGMNREGSLSRLQSLFPLSDHVGMFDRTATIMEQGNRMYWLQMMLMTHNSPPHQSPAIHKVQNRLVFCHTVMVLQTRVIIHDSQSKLVKHSSPILLRIGDPMIICILYLFLSTQYRY